MTDADFDGLHRAHLASLLDDDDDDAPPRALPTSASSSSLTHLVGGASTPSFVSPVKASRGTPDGLLAGGMGGAPIPLNPMDLMGDTPTKAEMLMSGGGGGPMGSTGLMTGAIDGASFQAWARQMTPVATTSRASTPGGLYIPQPSPLSMRGGLPQLLTPQRSQGRSPVSMEALGPGGSTAGGTFTPSVLVNSPGGSMDQLMEHRRQQFAYLQMAELAGIPPDPAMMQAAAVGAFFDPYATSNTAAVDQIRGRVYEIAKDQHGCRYLQRLLDTTYEGHEASQIIMAEIIPHVAELMTDQYANFLVQKLFDMMPHDMRFNVAQTAAPQIAHIALTPHGTFSVQKLIETIATREEMEVIRQSLARDVVRLVKDVHGNHVIQKVLQRFDHGDKQFIYDAMCADCASIATNKQGCCVLQRCLEFASPLQRAQLVTTIISCSLVLVQDPFGNYVVQYVLEGNDGAVNDGLATSFLPHLSQLCINKFSSNVVEKVLRCTSQGIRDAYVAHLKDHMLLARLLQDDFGNYVIQTALSVASPHIAENLVHAIKPFMAQIRNAPYAKKLEAKMELVMKRRSYRGSAGISGGFSPSSAAGGGSPVSSGARSPGPEGSPVSPTARGTPPHPRHGGHGPRHGGGGGGGGGGSGSFGVTSP